MSSFGRLEEVAWYITILFHGLLLWRMVRRRIAGRYPAITGLLLLQLIRSVWLTHYTGDAAYFRTHLNHYALTILMTEPLLIVCRALAVFELYGHVLSSYRGLSILGRTSFALVMTGSLAVSVAMHFSEIGFYGASFNALRALYIFETTVYTALLLFLLVLAAFVVYHPAPLKRNLLAHGTGIAVYMISSAMAVYLRNQDATQWTRMASTGRLILTVAGLGAWLLMIKRTGEEESVGVHVPMSEESQQRVLAQLAALNAILERK